MVFNEFHRIDYDYVKLSIKLIHVMLLNVIL